MAFTNQAGLTYQGAPGVYLSPRPPPPALGLQNITSDFFTWILCIKFRSSCLQYQLSYSPSPTEKWFWILILSLCRSCLPPTHMCRQQIQTHPNQLHGMLGREFRTGCVASRKRVISPFCISIKSVHVCECSPRWNTALLFPQRALCHEPMSVTIQNNLNNNFSTNWILDFFLFFFSKFLHLKQV